MNDGIKLFTLQSIASCSGYVIQIDSTICMILYLHFYLHLNLNLYLHRFRSHSETSVGYDKLPIEKHYKQSRPELQKIPIKKN